MFYDVVIIEDDPMVAAIDRQYVEANKVFHVCGVFKNGVEALEYLAQHKVDLIILDYYTPAMTGLEFLDALHGQGKAPSVIVVTSASDVEIVRELLARGVLDYLVKPFEFVRFRKALEKFLQRKKVLGADKTNLDQQAIDHLMNSQSTEGRNESLAKGLYAGTLNMIRDFLASHPEEAFTSEEIAEQVHLSRITIRRYVNYMVESGELNSAIDYQTGGRPCIRYSTVH